MTSNVTSMPEVAGQGACLVDPFDPRSIRQGIERVLKEDGYGAMLTANGFANALRFDPVRIANEYAALYREVASASTDS